MCCDWMRASAFGAFVVCIIGQVHVVQTALAGAWARDVMWGGGEKEIGLFLFALLFFDCVVRTMRLV